MKTNSTIRRCLILGVILILSIPIILNLILGLPSPCCVTVIGESTDWLLFWGSYLGGIITAAIGFLSIFISQRNSSEMHEAERQKELEKYRENQTKRLQDELILRIESLNFCSISRILPRFPSSVSREEVIKEIERLKERSEKAELQGIDWGLMSWHELPSKPKDFDGFYVGMIHLFKSDVDSVISLLNSYLEGGADRLDLREVERLNTEIYNHSLALTNLLAKPVKEWILEETGL